jgi:quercetin dioxygenase-like cupin family protein
MPVITSSDVDVFETHGVRFSSYVRPSRGSGQLCSWRVDVPAGLKGTPHRPSREEVICCIDGELTITLDGVTHALRAGDAAYVPPAAKSASTAAPTAELP